MSKKIIIRFFTLILLSTFVLGFSTETYSQSKPSKKARKLAQVADKFYNQGKYSDAVIKYAEALSISPYFPEARFFKGNSHYKQGQFDLAINELNLALEQGSDPLKVYTIRMESYAATGNVQSAIADAKKVVELEPRNSYYNAFLGKMYLANQAYSDSINYFERSIEQGSRDPNDLYFLAVAYNGVGNYEKQGISADAALKRGTQYSGNAWYLLADALLRERKYQNAAQAFENAINAYERDISLNRANADTENFLYLSFVGLSDMYRNLNRFEDAIKISKRGLSLRPNDGSLHISLTWYYSLAGQHDLAITAGKKAVLLASNQYMAYTNLCRAYNDEAEFLYSKEAIQLANKSFNNAINECKKALNLEPNDGETNYYLGRAYFYLDNEKVSKSYYEKSVDGLLKFTVNNPEYSDGYYLLGNAYFATGQNKKAINAYEKCLEISPRFARVRYNLGYVYLQEKNSTEARRQYGILKELDSKLAKRLLDQIEGK